jgi:hypothetical protein
MAKAKKVSEVELSWDAPDFDDRIAQADILAGVFPNGEKRSFWKRPLEEVAARGFPTQIIAIEIEVRSIAEFNVCQEAINKLKNLPAGSNS